MTGNIFDEMRKFQEEMNKMYSEFGSFQSDIMSVPGSDRALMKKEYRAPLADMRENDKNVVAMLELPGVDKRDIELNVTPDHITVKVEKKESKEHKGEDSYSFAQAKKSFYRRMPLPADVIADKAVAQYNNSVLRIEVPKREIAEQKRRRIDIK